jgi:hypothetical protein
MNRVLAAVLGISVLLAGCGEQAPAQAEVGQLGAVAVPDVAAPVEQPGGISVELLDPTQLEEVTKLSTLALTVDQVKSIQVFPSSLVLSGAGSPKFYVNGYDTDGKLLGKLNMSDLVVTQEVNQTLAITNPTATSFQVKVPNVYRSNTFAVALKTQPTTRAKLSIDVAQVKAGVLVVSDVNLAFPIPGVDPEQLTAAQFTTALAPFTPQQAMDILRSRTLANPVFPVVIKDRAAFKVGDLIMIPNAGTLIGKVKTVVVSGNKQLLTLEFVNPDEVFSQFDLNPNKPGSIHFPTTFNFGGQPLAPAGKVGAQALKPECLTTRPGGLLFQPSIQGEFKQQDRSKLALEVTGKMTLTVPLGLAGVSVDCEIPLAKDIPFQVNAFVTATPGLTIFMNGKFNAKAYGVNAELGIKGSYDVSGKTGFSSEIIQNFGIAGGGSAGIEAIATSTEIGASIAPQIYVDIRPGNIALQRTLNRLEWFFGRDGAVNPDDLFKIRISVGLEASLNLQLVNSGMAYKNKTSSTGKAAVSYKIAAELGGSAADFLKMLGLPLLAADYGVTLLSTETSTPKMSGDPKVDDHNGTADVQLGWDEVTDVNDVFLGNLSESLKGQHLTAAGGGVKYDVAECKAGPVKDDMLGYGALRWKDDRLGVNVKLFSNLPFYVDKPLYVCNPPKMSDPTPNPVNLRGKIGEIPASFFTFQNLAPGSTLHYTLSGSAGLKLGPVAGALAGNETASIAVAQECVTAGVQNGTVTVKSDDPAKPSVEVKVILNCEVVRGPQLDGLEVSKLNLDGRGLINEKTVDVSTEIKNYGDSPLEFYISNDSTSGLMISHTTVTIVQPGAKVKITASALCPKTAGIYTFPFKLTHNAKNMTPPINLRFAALCKEKITYVQPSSEYRLGYYGNICGKQYYGGGIQSASVGIAGGCFNTIEEAKIRALEIQDADYRNFVAYCASVAADPYANHCSVEKMPERLFNDSVQLDLRRTDW